jgi:cytochrome c peroxidase
MMDTSLTKRGLFAALLASYAIFCSDTFAAPLDEPILPLPNVAELHLDARKIKLGASLFNDVRLSKKDNSSCASCHNLSQGGVDGRTFSVGVDGQINSVNAPTVFNAANNTHQFWDGRANSLEEQINDHINDPTIMGAKWPEIIAKLSKDKSLSDSFKSVYADGINAAHATEAIATYERSLLTPSRFDRYLKGEAGAISAEELAGYKKFKDYGCIGCHQGVNVGGNMFQKLGVMRDYFTQRGNPTKADLGRYNVTKLEEDKHVFKVPSLRNITLTAPYLHDGTMMSLNDAVGLMFRYQLGRHGSEADKALIIKFLNTLTGEQLITK